MKKIFSILFLLAFAKLIFAQKQNLGFNLKVGETYNLFMHVSSNIKQQVNGQENNINADVSGKIAFKINGLENSIYNMEVNYQQLAITMKLPTGDLTFDSGNENKKDIFSSILRAMTNKPFFVKMTTVGKIVEVSNLDATFERVFDKFPEISTEQKDKLKAQMLNAYGEKAFKGSYETATFIYSNTAVEKGNTWVNTTNIEAGIAANLTTTFSFKDKTENYNLISGYGKMETINKDAYIKINEMSIRYDLNGKINSTLKVDANSGWILEAKIKQIMAGKAEIKDNPSMPGGLKIPMSIETVMSYSAE